MVLNFELEREILRLGESIQVMSPRILSGSIKRRLNKAVTKYAEEG
jgi:hypothetical protein